MKLYHGTNYSSAIDICQNGINLSCSELYLDFGPGFYTTPGYEHAAITAIRKTDKYNRLFPETLKKYNITEHNQDKRYDLVYGELADGNIINLAYMVNYFKLSPYNIDYRKVLKDSGEVYGHQYSFHTKKSLACITDIACGIIQNRKKYIRRIKGRRKG